MLTSIQRDFAGAIEEMTALFGRPPSYREMAAELDCSVTEIRRLALRLVDRGFIVQAAAGRTMKLVLCRPAPPLDETPFAVTVSGMFAARAHAAKAGAK